MMATLGTAYVNILANMKPLRAGLGRALSLVKVSMRKMARFARRGALVIAAAMTSAVVVAMKFEHEMAKVSTMLDKETMPIMQNFSDGIWELAKRYGQGTKTLSKGLYDILSASIPAADALHVLEVSARAAIAGVTETGIAADAITTILNSYSMSAKDAEMVSDKLFATVKRGKIEFPELASSIGMVSSSAAIVGMSLNDLLSVVATATRAGVPYHVVMTSINSVLNSFIKPSDDAKKAAKKFGVELSSTSLKTVGFLDAVKKLNKATPEQLAQVIENRRGFRSMAAALQNLNGLMFDATLISEKYAGKSSEALMKMEGTTRQKFDRMKQYLLSLMNAFGEKLLPTVTYVMARISMFFEKNTGTMKVWGEVVGKKIMKFIDWLDDVTEKTKTLGWEAGFEKVMFKIKEIIQKGWESLKTTVMPKVKEIGAALGRAFWTAFGDGIKAGIKNAALFLPLFLPRTLNEHVKLGKQSQASKPIGQAAQKEGRAATQRILSKSQVDNSAPIGSL